MARRDWLTLRVTEAGQTREITAQTDIANDPDSRRLEVGSSVDYDLVSLRNSYALVRLPEAGEPIRVVDNASDANSGLLFLESTLAEGKLIEVREIWFDFDGLERIHFVPRSFHIAEPRPDDWVDAMSPRGVVARLRMHTLMSSTVPARNRHEAALCLEMLDLRSDDEPARDDAGVWHYQATNPFGDTFDLKFRLEDSSELHATTVTALAGGPSRIIAPDFFRRRVDLAFETSALDPGEDLRQTYGQAIVYVDELVKMLPIEVDALWSRDAYQVERAHPGRYTAERLAHARARLVAALDQPPVVTVRSAEEAAVYMDAFVCPQCALRGFPRSSRVEARGSELWTVYDGTCPRCGSNRTFAMKLSEDMPPASTADAVNFGEGRSTALDAGQWLAAAERMRAEPTAYNLRLAIGAVTEAIKLIPDGATAVPEASLTSLEGWHLFDLDPDRLMKARLIALQDELVALQRGH